MCPGIAVVSTSEMSIAQQRFEDFRAGGFALIARTLDEKWSEDDHLDFNFKTYLAEDEIPKVLRCHQREIARFIHAQMQEHHWEVVTEYEVKVSKGFTELKECAYSVVKGEEALDFRQAPADKSNMPRYLFGGFRRCLYPVQKFQSDGERILAIILDRESLKWFKPAKGQFQIFYRLGPEQFEYVPDFVVETADTIFMLEPKARNQMETDEVQAKKAAAIEWCRNASAYASTHKGKAWRYVLIPHDTIAENMTIEMLAQQCGAP